MRRVRLLKDVSSLGFTLTKGTALDVAAVYPGGAVDMCYPWDAEDGFQLEPHEFEWVED